MPRLRAQSAMEYLMTYGWAILIIAVVLAALFQLGIFSGPPTPKATPGSCQVVKVGTGLTQTISLEGECQGAPPQFVAKFSGTTANIIVPGFSTFAPTSFTVSVWLLFSTVPPTWMGLIDKGECSSTGAFTIATNTGASQVVGGVYDGSAKHETGDVPATPLSLNTWYNVMFTYNGVGGQVYIDGSQVGTLTGSMVSDNLPLAIGDGVGGCNSGYFFSGSISNVQIYNTSLAPNEVNALYLEGIGGAPIRPANIAGWWPLNGNANDYSGNNDNGQATGITYSSSWTTGYVHP